MISIIIPNYNGLENLKKNLPKVIKEVSEIKGTEIIIVDDASWDDSVKFLEEMVSKNSNLKIFKNSENRGFAPTINKGVENSKGELIVLLNSDVYPRKDFLKASIDDMKDNEIFAVGFMDESMEDDKAVLRGRGIGIWKRGFLVHSAGYLDKKNNLWASGGSSMFRKNIWDQLGGLDEVYKPFYWEDIDISYRALRAGYKVLFEKNSVVVHEHEKGSIKKTYTKFQIKKIAYRNQFIFVWKNASLPIVISNILWFPYHLLKTLFNGDFAFVLGFCNAVILAPKVIVKRFKVQKMYRLSDKDVEVLS